MHRAMSTHTQDRDQRGRVFMSLLIAACVLPATLTFAFEAPAQTEEFDHAHALYDGVVKAHVARGMVDYAALKADSKALDWYFAIVAKVPETQFNAWSARQRLGLPDQSLQRRDGAPDPGPLPGEEGIEKTSAICLQGSMWDQPVVHLFGKTITLNNSGT